MTRLLAVLAAWLICSVALAQSTAVRQYDTAIFSVNSSGVLTITDAAIANVKLANPSLTIGSTQVPLGTTQATIAGLNLTSPNMTGTPVAPTAAATINSTQVATTAFVKSMHWLAPVSWIAGQNPNGAVVFTATQPVTVKAIVGRVETANGTAATVAINKVAAGTACSAGTIQHSATTFNANQTPAPNVQTLTVLGTAANNLAVNDSLCLLTTGAGNWTAGSAVGGITIAISPQ